MADNRYISIGMGVDIADLKTGLSQAKSEMRLADSEFKKRTAGLESWQDSAQGLAEKLVSLSSKIQTQREYVENLGKQWADAKEKFGESSKKATDALTAYNNAQSTLTKMMAEYEKYSESLRDLADDTELAKNKTSDLRKAIDSLEDHVKEQNSAVEKTKQQLAYVKTEYGENSQQAEALTRKLDTQEEQLDILNQTLGAYKTALNNAESEARDLDGEMDDLESSIKDADRAADNAGTGGFSTWKLVMSDLTSKVISGLIDKTKQLASQTLQLGIDFSSSMSEVQAISGATAEEMEQLEQTARDYGATTVFSASESAQALKYMSLAGWDANESTTALGGVLNLAASSGMDLAKASDMVTDYMSAFGLEAEQSGKFADMLAYAQSHANTTAEQLGDAYKNSAATLHANGQEVETVTALLSAMANQGLKGSEAGTALTAVMRDITTKMTDTGIAIGNTSVAVVDADGNFRSLTDIIADVESVTANMTDAQRTTALQMTFTTDSMKGLNMILGEGTGSIKAFEQQLASSDGTAQSMADTMNDNLGGDIKKLKSAFEELQLKLFDLLDGPLRGIVQFVTDNMPLVITLVAGVGAAFAGWKVAKVLGDMMGSIQKVIPVIQALTSTTALSTAGEIAHTAATTAMTAAQGLATAATTALSGAMAFLAANPIVLVIAAIAAIGTALFLLYDNCEWFRDAIDGIIDAVVGFFQWAYDEIVKVWNTLVSFFEGVWNGIQEVFGGVGDFFGDVADGAVEFFEDPWGSTVDFFGDIWGGIQDAFSGVGGFFEDVGKTANNFFKDPWGTTQDFFKDTVSTVKNCFVGVAEFFGINGEDAVKAFEWAWDTVKEFFDGIVKGIETIFGGITSFFGGIGNGAVQVFEDPWGSVTGFFGGIWDGIKGAFSGVGNFFGNAFNGAVDGIKSAFSGIKSFFEGIWNGIVGFFKPILSIFGVNLDSGTDTKLKEYEDRVAKLQEQTDTLTKIRDQRATEYNNARSRYGYYSSTTEMARNAYTMTSAQLTESQSALNKAKAELESYKNSKKSGSGGFIGDLTKNIQDGLTSGLAGIGDIITKPFKGAWDAVTGIFSGIGNWFNDNVVKPVSDALGGITGAVGDVVGGVADGIGKGANDVLGGVQKFGEDIFNGFCGFFGIHSPSTLMRDKIGKMIGAGISEGISLSETDTIKSMQHLSQGVNNALNVDSLNRGAGAGGTVIFNQNITSPTALSTGQIYRDTRSLIGRRTWA